MVQVCIRKHGSNHEIDLELPVPKIVLQDTLEQLGTDDPQNYDLGYIYWLENLPDKVTSVPDPKLEELNCFVSLWDAMNPDQRLMLPNTACLYPSHDMRSIINAAYNVDNCRLLNGISNDRQLGQYLLGNGKHQMSDAEKLGRIWREKERGIFTRDGYCFAISDFVEPYDGEHLPIEPEDYVFKVSVTSPHGEKELNLPAVEQDL